MKTALIVLWMLLSILGAVALAHVVGVINPTEKVNGLWLVVAAACIYVLAYRFYGRWLARKVVQLDDRRLTPAVRLNDGVNFHPTMPHFGETNQVGGKEIAISITSLRIGRWTVLGTLIHELAHSNGAPIDDALGNPSPLAERALLACGLGKQSELTSGIDDPSTPYDPTIRR